MNELMWQTGAVWLAAALLWFCFRALTVRVEDGEVVLLERVGKLARKLERPGLHLVLDRYAPWTRLRRVSLRSDWRAFTGIRINDARGTSATVDVWLELRIVDPEKATYAVEDWDAAVHAVVTHDVIARLGRLELAEIIGMRSELGEQIRTDAGTDLQRWGISLGLVFLQHVSAPSDIARHVLERVAAELERSKAEIEEDGRLRVAMLEADTETRIAVLSAEAKAQYPRAIGEALADLRRTPAVFEAYNQLYALSQLRPERTVAFLGFAGDELRAADAAMLATEGLALPEIQSAADPEANEALAALNPQLRTR